jgi:hypothetical protein
MIEEGSRLAAAAMVPQSAYVLHSRSDVVLRFAFPPGQGAATALLGRGAAADSEGMFPEAVGRHGNPNTVWLRRGDTGLGHSGYWGHPFTAPSVLRALRGRVAPELRPLPTLQQVSWSLPPSPELPDWTNRAGPAGSQRRPLG